MNEAELIWLRANIRSAMTSMSNESIEHSAEYVWEVLERLETFVNKCIPPTIDDLNFIIITQQLDQQLAD